MDERAKQIIADFEKRHAIVDQLELKLYDLYTSEWVEFISQYIPRYAEIEAIEFLGINRNKRGTKWRQLAEDISFGSVLKKLESLEKERLYRLLWDSAWISTYEIYRHHNFGIKEMTESAKKIKAKIRLPQEYHMRLALSDRYDIN